MVAAAVAGGCVVVFATHCPRLLPRIVDVAAVFRRHTAEAEGRLCRSVAWRRGAARP